MTQQQYRFHFPGSEFQIPAMKTANGQSWTRVTATDNGWAFVYRFGNRIKVRLYDRNWVPYTNDLSVDPTDAGMFSHDEPDISYNWSTRELLVVWNNRTNTPNIMDLRYNIVNVNGDVKFIFDRPLPCKRLESQWRPVIESYKDGWVVSFTGNDKDTAFYIVLNFDGYEVSSSGDIAMHPNTGHRQTDQHVIPVGDGVFMCAWTHVEGKGKIHYCIVNNGSIGQPNELPLDLKYGKAEPRLAFDPNTRSVWLVYHHETRGGEYWGIDVYATVFKLDDNYNLSVVKPEFCVHPNKKGLQLKPEIALSGRFAVIAWEHYPRGVVPSGSNPMPKYETSGGGSTVVARAFNLSGEPITNCVRVNTLMSNPFGSTPYCLRPSIDFNSSYGEFVICWTTDDHARIYSISGNNSCLWARPFLVEAM